MSAALRQRARAALAAWRQPAEHERQLADLRKQLAKARAVAGDRAYMLEAVVKMLGPKGQRVWACWQASGLLRIHVSWGPAGAAATGEEAAQMHLDLQASEAFAVAVTDVDGDLTRVAHSAPFEEPTQ